MAAGNNLVRGRQFTGFSPTNDDQGLIQLILKCSVDGVQKPSKPVGSFSWFNKFGRRIWKHASTRGRAADRKHIKDIAEKDVDEVINEHKSEDEV